MLELALAHRPCLVLTNATEPLRNRLAQLAPLAALPHRLHFRVSLDYPEAARHDAGRGPGAFQQSLRCLGELHRRGFGTSIARLGAKGEDLAAANAAYRPHFAAAGLPEETRIVVFPDFHRPGDQPAVPEITESCMTRYLNAQQRDRLMCNFSKMIVKQRGRMGVYACTLVDDDPDYCLAARCGGDGRGSCCAPPLLQLPPAERHAASWREACGRPSVAVSSVRDVRAGVPPSSA
jgi:hypothetical protein